MPRDCPLCGSKRIVTTGQGFARGYVAACRGCNHYGPIRSTRREARLAWNETSDCEWRFDDGQYISTCDPDKFINIAPYGMTFCPYCGKKLAIRDGAVSNVDVRHE